MLADLLADPPDYLLGMKAYDLLRMLPMFGKWRVGKVLERLEISPTKTIGGLTERQRLLIVAAVEGTKPAAGGRPAKRLCRKCGIEMRRASSSGVCGLCLSEAEEGRRSC